MTYGISTGPLPGAGVTDLPLPTFIFSVEEFYEEYYYMTVFEFLSGEKTAVLLPILLFPFTKVKSKAYGSAFYFFVSSGLPLGKRLENVDNGEYGSAPG